MSFVQGWEALDAKTFKMKLKTPCGLVLESFGKPSNPPFIMPMRVARTSAYKQIDDYTGSGPFVFKEDEWKPGDRVVYVRNGKYVPRREPPSGTAGGKVAKVDRVEWLVMKDPQLQANALAAREVDVIEFAPFELYPTFTSEPGIRLIDINPLGGQYYLRFNHLQPPFNNVKVRRAAMAALNQRAFLQIQVGVPDSSRLCFSVYPCGTPYATTEGMDFIAKPDLMHARTLLRESGYDGTAVVVMQPADNAVIARMPVVAAQLLRQAGFKVDMQSMTWQQLVGRRARKDGWNIFITNSFSVTVANPISNLGLGANCDKAWFGWPCDAELEKLRDRFARETDEQQRKAIAKQIQVRAMEIGTHVPLGESVFKTAVHERVHGFLVGVGGLALWNVEKE